MRPLRFAGNGHPNTPTNAKAPARRIAVDTAAWEATLHMPPVRVRVEAALQGDEAVVLPLPSEAFAEGLIRRLQYTRPKTGDIIGTHRLSRARPERSRA